jgi:HEAT repeat protein
MLKRTSRSIVAVLALALAASPALANGWEHWSIPLDVLLDGLANEEPGFRVRAARSLGIRKEATAVAPLLRLVDDPEEPPAVRVGAVEALGEIGDRQALQRLIKALADDPLGEVRTAATGALARIGGDAALTALLDAYERDRALVVRASVVEALAAFPVDRALAVLERLVRGRDAPNLRLKAIRALGQMRSRAATPALLGALTAAAGDPERSAIVEALASIADPAARESLERLFRETRNPELKVQATVALGAIRDGNTVASLIRLLADELAAVRFFAVEALIEAKDRAAGPARRAR